MFYYFNILYFYSLFGFVLESTVYKINRSHRYSSIFYGPITMVYGFGVLILTLVDQFFLSRITGSWVKRVIITYFTSVLILSLVEWMGGEILYALFRVNLWNYSNKMIHFGKYVCLDLALVWGLLGTIYLMFFKNFSDKVVALLSKRTTICFIIFNLIDLVFVFINKFAYW